MKAYGHVKIFNPIFTVTLFIIAETYVTKLYLIGKWINVIHPDNGMLVLKGNS